MTRGRTAGALLVGLAAVLVTAALSRIPVRMDTGDEAVLRLSWRIRGEAGEACRAPTPEELEALPVHMRNPDACQRRGLAYRLRAWVDGAPVVDRVLAPSGVRGDRPIYVFEEVRVDPGRRTLRVTFTPADSVDAGAGPTALGYEGPATFAAGRAILITLGADADGTARLELRNGSEGPP